MLKVFTYKETFNALQSIGWIDNGNYVKIVLKVVVTMGLASEAEVEQLMKKEVHSKNMLKIMCRCF
jgi:hypothetical protein